MLSLGDAQITVTYANIPALFMCVCMYIFIIVGMPFRTVFNGIASWFSAAHRHVIMYTHMHASVCVCLCVRASSTHKNSLGKFKVRHKHRQDRTELNTHTHTA